MVLRARTGATSCRHSLQELLEATKKNYLEPLEPTKQQKKRPLEHPLETTQLKPKWKKLRVTGDIGGTSGDEIVE